MYKRQEEMEVHDLGRSFFPVYNAHRLTLATFTTLNRTPEYRVICVHRSDETHINYYTHVVMHFC